MKDEGLSNEQCRYSMQFTYKKGLFYGNFPRPDYARIKLDYSQFQRFEGPRPSSNPIFNVEHFVVWRHIEALVGLAPCWKESMHCHGVTRKSGKKVRCHMQPSKLFCKATRTI